MLNKITLSLLTLLFTNTVIGFELTQITGTQTSISSSTTTDTTKGRKHYEIAKSVVAPSEVTGYIPFNKQVGILTFSILVPQKSIITMKWDNEENFFSRIGKRIKFRRAGEYQTISFNATKLTSGYISLYNANNKLLKKIHYTMKKQNAYSQNIRAYVRDSKSGNTVTNSDNNSLLAGVGYSISQRVNIGDPRLSLGVSVSTDLNDSASRSITASLGYSW